MKQLSVYRGGLLDHLGVEGERKDLPKKFPFQENPDRIIFGRTGPENPIPPGGGCPFGENP